ncbi:MAG: hypothetical protein ACXVLQ_00215 [Bacteriovorax sp.]
MKKVIILVGLLTAFGAQAETYERTLVKDYIPVPSMDFAFEIKTSKFQKVILDCQSFVTGMNFYNDKKVVHSFYLDAYGDCQNMHDFIKGSKEKNLPVCLEIETESNSLTVSNAGDDCQ